MSGAWVGTHRFTGPATAAWHDVECGSFAADLALWEELAAAATGPLLELGCGTGRVALHLARRDYDVTGLDSDAELLDELRRRARERGLSVGVVKADAQRFALEERFALVLAPMQIIQLVDGASGRARMLRGVSEHLRAGGLAAMAIVAPDAVPPGEGDLGRPPPDVREIEGWVLSSLPVALRRGPEVIEVTRLRQTVSPAGDLQEQTVVERLRVLAPETLEAEARAVGLRPVGRREILATEEHVASVVVLLEAEW